MSANKILVIGSGDYDIPFTTVAWQDKFPYVADYDCVILDLVSLDSETLSALCDQRTPKTTWSHGLPPGGVTVRNRLRERMGDFYQLLKSGGNIICIVSEILESEEKYAYQGGGSEPVYSSLDWCPLRFQLKRREGDTLTCHDPDYGDYFALVKTWTAVVQPEIDDSRLFGGDSLVHRLAKAAGAMAGAYSLDLRSIAANRAGEYVGLEIRWDLKTPGPVSPKPGALVVLPPPSEASMEEAILTLCQMTGGRGRELPPGWVESTVVPGELGLGVEIERLRAQASKLEAERSLGSRLKALLYESGAGLEEAVRDAFAELGCAVRQPTGMQEDLIIEWESQEACVEVKGKKKAFSLTDLRQLGHYLEDAELDRRQVKGIFVGNHYRNRKPAKRSQAFPPNVIQYANRRSIALVATIDLFRAICQVRAGERKASEVIGLLFAGKGVVSLVS